MKQKKLVIKDQIFTCNAYDRQIHRDRRRLVFIRCWQDEWGVTINGYKVSYWGDKNVLKLDGDDGYTSL